MQVAALRAAVAGGLLLLMAAVLRRPQPRPADVPALLAVGVCSTAVGFAGMFLAGNLVPPGIATVVASTQPLIAAALGNIALGERVAALQIAGMTAALAGTAAVAAEAAMGSAGSGVSLPGLSFVLLGAFGVAAGNVLMKRVAGRIDPIAGTAWQLLAGAAVLWAASRAVGPPAVIRWTPQFVIAVAVLAVPGTAIAFVLWFALLRNAPLNTVNAASFLTPVFALGIGALWFGERLSVARGLGSALVVAGAAVASRHRLTAREPE